jgi:hypothetical protein
MKLFASILVAGVLAAGAAGRRNSIAVQLRRKNARLSLPAQSFGEFDECVLINQMRR